MESAIGPVDTFPLHGEHDEIRFRLLQRAGLIRPPPPKYTKDAVERLYETEWLPWFEEAMRCRLVMGALRYRTLRENARLRPKRDVIQSCIKRLEAYLEGGNMEHLVDVANLCMIEANNPNHPDAHFGSQDEHPFHVREFLDYPQEPETIPGSKASDLVGKWPTHGQIRGQS